MGTNREVLCFRVPQLALRRDLREVSLTLTHVLVGCRLKCLGNITVFDVTHVLLLLQLGLLNRWW